MTRNSGGSWKPDTCRVAKVSKPPTTLAAASANFSTSPKTPSFPVPRRAKQKQPREMENRARLLRVQKSKPTTKRSGRKPLLKKLASFLKCDTFMYAPLVSPLPPDFPSPDNFASSAKVVELRKPRKESQCFLERVEEYLKSDVYMYAPLLNSPPHSPRETLQHCGKIRMDASPRRLTMKVNEQTDLVGNANQRSESHLFQADLSEQLTLGQKETVKHTVYQSCRSASASRNVTFNSHLRAHS